MMGMKKRVMRRGGGAMKKRVKKKNGGMTDAQRKAQIKVGKKKFVGMTDRQRAETQVPGRKKKQISKTAKGSKLKGKTTFAKPVKNPVRTKGGQIVRDKSGKAITFGGKEKLAELMAKRRANRMGGGMMKKRMKRGGKAK